MVCYYGYMQIIAILSQKGGTGKTTLALNLAVAAEIAGRPSVVVDLDPQASAKGWDDHREAPFPDVVSAQAARLPDVLATARAHGALFVVIDTAPHSESAALTAARAAHQVLIPCRPGILDLRAIAASGDIAVLAQARAHVVLNAVPARGPLADEAAEAISRSGLAIAPVRIGQRAAFVHSLTAGQTVHEYERTGKAAQEIQALYLWACQLNELSA